jgi:hypothetical protein
MTFAISMSPAYLKRIAFLVIASTLLFLTPGRLAAQAAGANSGAAAGTPGGQGNSAGEKSEHRHRTPQEVEQAFRNAKGGKVKKSPKIKNTHTGEDPQTAAMLAALQQLKAGGEGAGKGDKSGAGKGGSGQPGNPGGSSAGGPGTPGAGPGGKPTGGGGKTSGGSASGSTPSGGAPGGSAPGSTPGTSAGASRAPINATTVATLRAPVAVTATAPAPPPPNSGSSTSISSRAVASQATVSSVVACASKNLVIQSVNGARTGASNPSIVFTQDPQFNDYKISGCNFGSTQGQAHLSGPFRAGQVAMQIELWTDTMIELKVQPNLTGEGDQNNVSLVIAPVGGAQAQLQNCKFYAMRQEVTLAHLPQSQVTLGAVTDTGGYAVPNVHYSSPYNGQVSQGTQTSNVAFTGGVDRYDTYRFGPGTDVWDFSTLAPGFVPTQFSLSHWALDQCGVGFNLIISDPTVYDDGQWSAQWDPGNPKHLIVNFAEQHCHDSNGGDDASNSSYALEIQVAGPAGVNPLP